MKKGLFITFEGGEGAGKTSLIQRVKQELKAYDLVVTREPGGTKFGEHVRSLLLESRDLKLSIKAELCLFLASRAQHIQDVILPALGNNKLVLCDRYNDSSIAYQGQARGLGIDEVIDFSSFIVQDVMPDLTLYLDIDPKIGLGRVKGDFDKIESEKISFHQKIREGFHLLQKKYPSRIYIIDANLSQEQVFNQAYKYIKNIVEKCNLKTSLEIN